MDLIEESKNAVIKASTIFREDQLNAYQKAVAREINPRASWILKLLIENAEIARENKVPLCDDTGIPHVLVEMGNDVILPKHFMEDVKEGIRIGLKELPGRPMAVKGNDLDRIGQKVGLYDDPGEVVTPSFILSEMDPVKSEINTTENEFDSIDMMNRINQDKIKVHILMLGGGPEIRSSTYRVFHRRDYQEIFKEMVSWLKVEIPKLGCIPCIPTIGIGRTHLEASTLMLKAMAHGNLEVQSELEKNLTKTINSLDIGALNMGGVVTALGSFINIGPQRASGVRILSIRPCCCVEPRVSSFDYPL
ncbi:MAG: fumarate hydratase [Methanothermobacter sp.]